MVAGVASPCRRRAPSRTGEAILQSWVARPQRVREHTARIGRARKIAEQRGRRGACPLDHRVRYRHRVDQRARVRMAQTRDTRGHRCTHHATEVQHQQAATDVAHDREVVADETTGDAGVALDVGEQVEDLRLDRYVERADGGLVQITSCGSATSARARVTRWFCPPESSCGYGRQRPRQARPARASPRWPVALAGREPGSKMSSGSRTLCATVKRGFRLAIGPGTPCARWRVAAGAARAHRPPVMSLPRNPQLATRERHEAQQARGRASTLPQPDSPTTPGVSPGAIEKLTSSTARSTAGPGGHGPRSAPPASVPRAGARSRGLRKVAGDEAPGALDESRRQGGASLAQRGPASRQRGANASGAGLRGRGWLALDGTPGRAAGASSSRGRHSSSACTDARARGTTRRPRRARRSCRRTSPRPRRRCRRRPEVVRHQHQRGAGVLDHGAERPQPRPAP